MFPSGETCTVEAGRLAVNQSMSLLNYSSMQKLQAWQMQDQICSSVYRDTGDFLPPFLAMVSWAGKKQKSKPLFFLSEYRSHEALYACTGAEVCTGSGCGWLRSPTGYWTSCQGTFLGEDFLGKMPWWLWSPPRLRHVALPGGPKCPCSAVESMRWLWLGELGE